MSSDGHVLLVEDSEALSDAFRIMLERSGFKVSVANNLADALAVSERADVLLLDLSLPDGDGMSLLSRLESEGRLPKVSIALTGHDDAATRDRCLNAGCKDVIVKPIRIDELVARVRLYIS